MSTYRGKMENGKVVFEGLVPPLPNGTPVDITPRSESLQTEPNGDRKGIGDADPFDTLGNDAVDTGIADGSVEHDHYIYGSPKRGQRKDP